MTTVAKPKPSLLEEYVLSVPGLRIRLLSLLPWDEFTGMAPVCKSTAAIVGGQGLSNGERRRVFEFMIAETFVRLARFNYGVYTQCKTVPVLERFKDMDLMVRQLPGGRGTDVWAGYLVALWHAKHPPPLRDVLSIPLYCAFGVTKNGPITLRSVIYRARCHTGDDPRWLRDLLADKDSHRTASQLRNNLHRVQSIDLMKVTWLSTIPRGLIGTARTVSQFPDHSKQTVPLKKYYIRRRVDHERSYMGQLRYLYKMRLKHAAEKREAEAPVEEPRAKRGRQE